ncbi:cation/H(+) antiporter 15-like [Tasmannia lanceolata]|uniref:cation/H(+) antiporter 15-like n=1 Tax=Tasmannia lanceolata TaxID=3420 RepID=UPI0040646C49
MASLDPRTPLGRNQTARENITDTNVVCYAPNMVTTRGVWEGDDPLNYALPLFLLQLIVVVATTRTLFFILKPLRQPRVVAEIIGGILLGPSCLGRCAWLASKLFPLRSVTVMETMANVGLHYFLFLVGVEMDIIVIKRTGKKAILVAFAGMIIPFIIGTSSSFFLKNYISKNIHQGTFLLFLGVALSITAFPVLARILTELKLLNTDLGRVAMASAIINDVCAWVLLALAIALVENQGAILASLWVILSGVAFVLFCIYAIRPAIRWVIRRTPEGEPVNEFYVCAILVGVMTCGFITDALGINSIFGAFVFGLVIPNGPLGISLMEKLEDFVSGLLLPLYFAISGLRTNVYLLSDFSTWGFLLLVIILASAGKVVGTMAVAFFYKMPFREGFTLGMLMNTKGLIEMIVLNIGRDQKILDESSFAVMVLTAVIMTGMITPVVMAVYRPTKHFLPYKHRTIKGLKPNTELRLMACIHSPRNVPTIINLVEASYPSKKSPIFLYTLHLVELTGRASAMVIIHNSGKPSGDTEENSDHIANAFHNYAEQSTGVSVQSLTAVSPYSSMHEDICNLAEEKRAALIIVPFHKEQAVDGALEATNAGVRTVNQNLLANAPCSIGILVDRGLGGGVAASTSSASHVAHHVVMLFFGGPDDREALAYAWRMSEHPGVSLTVLRLVVGEDAVEPPRAAGDDDAKILTVITDYEKEKQLDDDFISEFRVKNVNDESVVYMEKVVNDGEETVAAISCMDSINDLYIVGRGQGTVSPLTTGMTDWSECPELGAIGDLLASSDFSATVSVLVIQQYVGAVPNDVLGTPDSPSQQIEQYLNNNNARQMPHRGQGSYFG